MEDADADSSKKIAAMWAGTAVLGLLALQFKPARAGGSSTAPPTPLTRLLPERAQRTNKTAIQQQQQQQ